MDFLTITSTGLVIGVVFVCIIIIYTHFSGDPRPEPWVFAFIILGFIFAFYAFAYCPPEPY